MRALLPVLWLALAPIALAQEDDWGFDDEETYVSDASESVQADDRFWNLTGDLSLGTSYNYLDHDSPTGTPYGNLSRLRAQLDLQLDLDLPWEWKIRIEGYGFYDFTYVLKGRSQYTRDVRDDYIWEVDFREVWLQGSLGESLDVKVGRQIVNWGRSDTVRVLDVLNPLDNREPGLVDIEDLRLPVTMARVDYYPKWIPDGWGDWSLQLLVIPEFRQDRNPSIGSDFNPAPLELDPPSNKPDRFFDEPEYGGAITGTFSGWDVSVYAARIYVNQPLIAGIVQRYPLVTMVGGGGNLTFGSWLFKGEVAYQDGYNFTVLEFDPVGAPLLRRTVQGRVDAMVGVEFYGVSDLILGLEVVNRHYPSYVKAIGEFPYFIEQNQVELAARVNWDLMNERLHLLLVGVVFQIDASGGSFVRLQADYDIIDALEVGGGILLFQRGDNPLFGSIDDNDRIFLHLKYSF